MKQQLNSKHQKTLGMIFEEPTRSDVRWTKVESLLKALGATIRQGRGSRIRVELNGCVASFHTPHPQPEMVKGSVEAVRDFLINADISP